MRFTWDSDPDERVDYSWTFSSTNLTVLGTPYLTINHTGIVPKNEGFRCWSSLNASTVLTCCFCFSVLLCPALYWSRTQNWNSQSGTEVQHYPNQWHLWVWTWREHDSCPSEEKLYCTFGNQGELCIVGSHFNPSVTTRDRWFYTIVGDRSCCGCRVGSYCDSGTDCSTNSTEEERRQDSQGSRERTNVCSPSCFGTCVLLFVHHDILVIVCFEKLRKRAHQGTWTSVLIIVAV